MSKFILTYNIDLLYNEDEIFLYKVYKLIKFFNYVIVNLIIILLSLALDFYP